MAVELVGGALLSGFISVIFERLAPGDVIMEFCRGKKDLVKLLEELKIKLVSANVLLSDAEEKQLTNSEVRRWLDELTHVIYTADFLMDKIDTEALQGKIKNESATTTSKIRISASTSSRKFEESVKDEGKEIMERLTLLLDQTIHLGLKEDVPTRSLRMFYAPLVVEESDVVGRDGDKEEIIELLLSDNTGGKNLSVIPIVGMSGIGKTTLAQLVYKDSRVQQHFDLEVWVTVSEEFNVFQITNRIYKELTSEECTTRELSVLQSKLQKAIAGRRFLFVLDDVWNVNYRLWDALKGVFRSRAHGSKIIVTTRSKDVALTMSGGVIHELKLASDKVCWLIFEKHVFGDNQAPTEELQKIGREVVERCKGLPLAVKSVGGLLRTTLNPEEWRKVINRDIWQLLNRDIWQLQFQECWKAVWLSYHFLPPVLKRCFAYCSIFPKDYEFEESDMEKIILLWMAEGLLTPEKGKRMEDVGKAYLQALMSRSFFIHSRTSKSAMVMHDLVHDLAMFVSGEFCFSCGNSNDLSNLGTKSCHLSYRKRSDVLMKLVSRSMSLRTLLALPLSHVSIHKTPVLELHELFLKVGGCLRVLSLSCLEQITELPDSIGNMKCLRYLDLSYTSIKELPDSICTLYNLQTLLLSNCPHLEQLPTRFADLVNLRHLDIRCPCLKEMPQQMCEMKSLQTLSYFVLGENDGGRIKELGEFPLLGGSLHISGLENIVDVRDVLEANLKDKKFLSELILEWGGDSNITSSQQEKDVLEALQPHANLKQLRIKGYRGTIFPDWVGHESFCNMVAVGLTNVCILPPLGQLSSLRRLEMIHLDGVGSIGNEFCGSSFTTTNRPFTSLEYLHMECVPLESFALDYFPKLDELDLKKLEYLVELTGDSPDELEELYIHQCPKLEFPGNRRYASLQKLVINKCDAVKSIPLDYFPKLYWITLTDCQNFESFRFSEPPPLVLESLAYMELQGLPKFVSFPEGGLRAPNLRDFHIKDCKKLTSLPQEMHNLGSLEILKVECCPEIESFAEDEFPSNIKQLWIRDCTKLTPLTCIEICKDWLV